jgi:DNA-binding GntR family transcriptional regulator
MHLFELSAVLESHAVARVATASGRDLYPARAGLATLELVIQRRQFAAWVNQEVRFHRVLNDQSGNQVLAAMAERTLREGLTACPILSPDVLNVLQSHHRAILRCIEDRAAEAAARHTRSHLLYLRDALVDALHGSARARFRLYR